MAASLKKSKLNSNPKSSAQPSGAVAKNTGTVESVAKNFGLDLDRLIHEKTRLAIVSALAVNQVLTFNELKSLLNVSDGNLSAHARKLEDAQYVSCSKGFDGRIPRTQYKLTAKGRSVLQNYIVHMEALITAMKTVDSRA